MPGTIVKPDLPSSVVHFVGETTISIPPAFNTVVGCIGSHDSGPLATDAGGVDVYESLTAFEAINGSSTTPGHTAAVLAFLAGAGGFVFARAATSAAAAATIALNNTTPAAALRLTAIYKGSGANSLSVIRDDDPVDGTKDRLRLLFRGAQVESYSYVATDIASLVGFINARSRYVTAAALITGVTLAATGGTALAGGNDGSTLTAAEYLVAQDSLEFADFGAFAPASLVDPAVKVQLATWRQNLEDEMRPFRMVLGGALGESVDDGLAELNANASLRDDHIVRVAVGSWYESTLDMNLSTSQLAPYFAGLLAARGERAALTRAAAPTLSAIGTASTTDDLKAGRDGGLTMLRRVSSPTTMLAVSQGVTTFIDPTVAAKPLALFTEPRIIGLFDRIVRQIVDWGDEVVIGDLPVNDDTRNLVRKEIAKILDDLESTGLSEPGSGFVNVDPPDDPALRDAIPYQFGFVPTLTANYLIGEGRVR